MKIVVCIKQVPDTKGGVKFNPDGTLDRSAMMAIMNPDDKAGLEAALRLKDQYGADVTVITMGLKPLAGILIVVWVTIILTSRYQIYQRSIGVLAGEAQCLVSIGNRKPHDSWRRLGILNIEDRAAST